MRRRHWHPSACVECGKPATEAHISQTGRCEECWLAAELENIAQLEAGAGPYYDHWLIRLTLAMRRRVVARERAAVYAEGSE